MAGGTKRGFTIVELLVVITIIGILMAFLFPAINAARNAARKHQCVNNQRNIGQGGLAFAASSGGLMPGAINWFPATRGSSLTSPHFGWVYQLLPHVGRSDILDNAPATGVTNAYYSLLVCPSDPPPVQQGTPVSYIFNMGQQNRYTAAAGIPYDWPDNGACDDSRVPLGDNRPVATARLGFIAKNDGTSTTFMLSENVNVMRAKVQWGKTAPVEHEVGFVWNLRPTTPQRINVGMELNLSIDTARPSSRHAGGVNATMCDGSVRFLNEDLDMNVYALLMTPNGAGVRSAGTTTRVPQTATLNEADIRW